jgi:hypothetical protein
MIYAQVTPSTNANVNQPSPNPVAPTFSQNLSASIGTIIACAKTGRLWMLTPGNPTNEWKPVLPYTRNDSGTTGVQVTNSNGNMQFSQAAGASGGSVNLLGQIALDGSQIVLPAFTLENQNDGPLVAMTNGTMASGNPMVSALSDDISIGTSLTTVGTLTIVPNLPGVYRVHVVGLLYHANQFRVTVGIRYWNTAQDNYFLNSTTVESQQGGWHGFALSSDVIIQNELDSIRIGAISSVEGVTMKAQPADSLPFPGLPQNPNRSTRMLIQRIRGVQ